MIDTFHIENVKDTRIEIQFDQQFKLFQDPFTLYYSDSEHFCPGKVEIDSFLFNEKKKTLIVKIDPKKQCFILVLCYYGILDKPKLHINDKINNKKRLNSASRLENYSFIQQVRDIYLKSVQKYEKYHRFFAEYDYRAYREPNDEIMKILKKKNFYRGHFGKQSIVFPDQDYYDKPIKDKIDSLYWLQKGIIYDYFREGFSEISEAFYLFASSGLRKQTLTDVNLYQPNSWHIMLWPEFFFLALETLKLDQKEQLYCYKLLIPLVIMQDVYIQIYGKDIKMKKHSSYNIAFFSDYPSESMIKDTIDSLKKNHEDLISFYNSVEIEKLNDIDDFQIIILEYKLKKVMGELTYKAFSDGY